LALGAAWGLVFLLIGVSSFIRNERSMARYL